MRMDGAETKKKIRTETLTRVKVERNCAAYLTAWILMHCFNKIVKFLLFNFISLSLSVFRKFAALIYQCCRGGIVNG